MTLRDIINPWGALRKAREMCEAEERNWYAEYQSNMRKLRILMDIAAMETAKPNATVKRMAERAREGMK